MNFKLVLLLFWFALLTGCQSDRYVNSDIGYKQPLEPSNIGIIVYRKTDTVYKNASQVSEIKDDRADDFTISQIDNHEFRDILWPAWVRSRNYHLTEGKHKIYGSIAAGSVESPRVSGDTKFDVIVEKIKHTVSLLFE